MSLTAAERETTIQFSDADEVAYVFTAQPPMMRKLRRIKGAKMVRQDKSTQGTTTMEEWEIPLWAVSFRTKLKRGGGKPTQASLDALKRGLQTRKTRQSDHSSGDGT